MQNLGDAFIANLRTGFNGPAARQEFRRIRAQRKHREQLVTIAVARWIAASNSGGRQLQYVGDDARVQVQSGWSRDHQCDTTDCIVTHRTKGGKEHLHIVFSDRGDVICED